MATNKTLYPALLFHDNAKYSAFLLSISSQDRALRTPPPHSFCVMFYFKFPMYFYFYFSPVIGLLPYGVHLFRVSPLLVLDPAVFL